MSYRLGCPVFGARSWLGEVLPARTSPRDQLSEYARIFGAVEGNGTFYGLPTLEAAARWAEDTPDSFRFAFKVPKEVSHQPLDPSAAVLARFFEVLEPLGARFGSAMLQLPPWLDFRSFRSLRRFVERWPAERSLSVELRHPDWFDDGRRERDLHRMLSDHGAERVCLDSRALFGAPASDPATAAAQGRKPRVPVRFVGLGRAPLVRIIGRNDPAECASVLSSWADVVARWMDEGRRPLVFCHTPDEHYAPRLARAFHEGLRVLRPELEALPSWPLPPRRRGPQLDLL